MLIWIRICLMTYLLISLTIKKHWLVVLMPDLSPLKLIHQEPPSMSTPFGLILEKNSTLSLGIRGMFVLLLVFAYRLIVYLNSACFCYFECFSYRKCIHCPLLYLQFCEIWSFHDWTFVHLIFTRYLYIISFSCSLCSCIKKILREI